MANIGWIDGQLVYAVDLNALGVDVNTRYIKPGGGIPASDMTAAVIASLGKADTAAQPADVATAQLVALNAQVANYTLVLADANKAIEVNKATAATVTVPPNVFTYSAGTGGTCMEIVQVGAGQVTIVAGAGVTINYASSLTTRTQWSVLGLRQRGTNVWLVTGDST